LFSAKDLFHKLFVATLKECGANNFRSM